MAASQITNKTLKIDQVIPNPFQQRKSKGFEEDKIRELGESIGQYGLQQPIKVTRIDTDSEWLARIEAGLEAKIQELAPNLETEGADFKASFYVTALENLRACKANKPAKAIYLVCFGERRWRASMTAGMTEIDSVVDKTLDPKKLRNVMILENGQREDVGFFEEAQSYVDWMAEHGLDPENPEHRKILAQSANKSVMHIGWRLDSLKLVPEAQEALKREELSANAVYQLARMDNEIQQRKLLAMIQAGKCQSLFQLEATAKAIKGELDKANQEQGELEIEVQDKSKALKLIGKVDRLIEQLCSIAEADDTEEGLEQMSEAELDRMVQQLELARKNIAFIKNQQVMVYAQAAKM